MRICIDARCLLEGRRTGVEEYTLGILENIFILDKENKYVLFLNSAKEPKFDFSVFSKYENVEIRRFRFPNKILNFLFWYLGWPKIDRLVGGADAVFLPNINFFSLSKGVKSIVTIHDLSFERYPEHFSRKRRWWHMFVNPKKICRRADRIIAVSDSTKDDIVNVYGINPEKIQVIPSAVAPIFKRISRNDRGLIRVKEKFDLPYKFILFLGTIEPRKNLIGLVRAFDSLKGRALKANDPVVKKSGEPSVPEELLKYKLVIAGESGWENRKIFEEISRSRFREDIMILNFVPHEDKPYLYNLASLFVYPSFFEGFGFPPLEAMSCGVPVVASNSSSIPEIVGSAGILVDPDKPDEIYRAMREVLSDKKFHEALAAKGLSRSKNFNWETAAHLTLLNLEG